MLEDLLFIKAVLSILIVVLISVIAERINLRVAGILSGYPTTTAISLFFFGLEISPQFASDSVTYNLIGLIATQFFIYFYYLSSNFFHKRTLLETLLYSSVLSFLGYGIVVYLLRFLPSLLFLSVILAVLSILLFARLFRSIREVPIKNRVAAGPQMLVARALFAGLVIVAITEMAKWVGPAWAGLLSAFPATVFPLLVILHFTYPKEHVHSFIKHIPQGNVTLLLYSLTIAVAYPLYGVWAGTLLALVVAGSVSLLSQTLLSKSLA